MSSALIVRIIGGVCGGTIGVFISGKIYDFFIKKPDIKIPIQNTKENTTYNSCFENHQSNKIKDANSFEDIFNNQLKEYINNSNKYTYEYDNEYGNIVEPTKNIEETEKEIKYNNYKYNNYKFNDNDLDYYSLLFNYDITPTEKKSKS